jgi:urease subunit alpha
MFGGYGAALDSCSVHFVSRRGIETGALEGLSRRFVAVRGCRTISKRDLLLNDALPKIEVNADTYEVRADGQLLTCEPADVLPLAQRYFLF